MNNFNQTDYAPLNPTLSYNSYVPNSNPFNFTYYKENPSLNMTQTFNAINDNENYYCGNQSSLALNGIQVENTPLSLKYFSNENIKRIQKYIRYFIHKLSKQRYDMKVEQNESDLLVAMRAVFLSNARFLSYNINEQVKELNKKTLKYILPDMMTNIEQQLGYIKDITNPINPIDRPLNVNSAGRKTLPSTMTVYGF